jgi:hypothetical protein
MMKLQQAGVEEEEEEEDDDDDVVVVAAGGLVPDQRMREGSVQEAFQAMDSMQRWTMWRVLAQERRSGEEQLRSTEMEWFQEGRTRVDRNRSV